MAKVGEHLNSSVARRTTGRPDTGLTAYRAGPQGRQPHVRGHSLEVIVPALNEERRLARCLRSLRAELAAVEGVSASIRVIDNGSTDRTAEVVDEFARSDGPPVSIHGCSRPGKGSAVARGMITSRADWVGFCDADLATPASTIAEAVSLLADGWAVVVGSRRVEGAHVGGRQSMWRRIAGAGFRVLTRDMVEEVEDTQCGFKFFQGEAARTLFARTSSSGFAFDVEVLALARDLQMPIKEIPVLWTDGAGSTLRPVRDGMTVAREINTLRRQRRSLPVLDALPALGR
jgi:dolichyl-phosphate beta-glucosyltransferase